MLGLDPRLKHFGGDDLGINSIFYTHSLLWFSSFSRLEIFLNLLQMLSKKVYARLHSVKFGVFQ